MDLCKSGDHPVAPDQKYPYNKSYFTWGELRCLARCLGLSIFRPQRDLPALLPNPMEATSVSGDTRREMAAAARLAAKPLRPAVRVSNRKVESMRHSRTSRDCCSPCPPVVSVEDATGGNRRHRNGDEDCRVGDDIRGRDIPVSQWHCQPVVSQNEIDEHRILMESLEWDLMLKEQSGHVFEEAKVTV